MDIGWFMVEVVMSVPVATACLVGIWIIDYSTVYPCTADMPIILLVCPIYCYNDGLSRAQDSRAHLE